MKTFLAKYFVEAKSSVYKTLLYKKTSRQNNCQETELTRQNNCLNNAICLDKAFV